MMENERQIRDLARLAAFIDGEGCIGVYKRAVTSRGTLYRLQVQIANTDPKLMVWLKHTFGGRVKPGKFRGNKLNRKYDWIVQGPLAAYLLYECIPYFVLKGDQALLAISFQPSRRGKNYGRAGMPPALRSSFEFCSRTIRGMKMRNQIASEMIQ